jgi:hypothetical protein
MGESDLECVRPPKIGGTLPHDEYIRALYSIAKSLKRIADALDATKETRP